MFGFGMLHFCVDICGQMMCIIQRIYSQTDLIGKKERFSKSYTSREKR